MHILICDINIKKQGHNIGYNQYIIDHCNELNIENQLIRFSFLYNSEAEILLNLKEHQQKDIHYVTTGDNVKEGWRYKFKLFRKMVAIANNLKVDKVIFLDVDKYQLFIFMSRMNFKISGILFRPHHRIESSNKGLKNRTESFIKRTKKIATELLLTTKKSVEKIFILNDAEGTKTLNEFHRTTKFCNLPDPIFSYPGEEKFDLVKRNGNYKFLVFGALNERKNITNILKAYESASFDYATELILIGPSEKSYTAYLENLIRTISVEDLKNKEIIVRNAFVSDQQMDWIFSQSDVVMLVYKDFYGSSGLLGRACVHQVKVMGPNVGLLKNMISSYELGLLCDPKLPEDIARVMTLMKNTKIEPEAFLKFYTEHSPDKFIKSLILNVS